MHVVTYASNCKNQHAGHSRVQELHMHGTNGKTNATSSCMHIHYTNHNPVHSCMTQNTLFIHTPFLKTLRNTALHACSITHSCAATSHIMNELATPMLISMAKPKLQQVGSIPTPLPSPNLRSQLSVPSSGNSGGTSSSPASSVNMAVVTKADALVPKQSYIS